MRASGRYIKAKAEKIRGRMRRKRPAAGVNNTTSGSFTPTEDEGSSSAQAGNTGQSTEKDAPDSRPEINPGPPIKSNDEASQSTASQLSSDAQAVDTDGNISPVQAEGNLDLWKEALDKLPEKQRRGLSSLTTTGNPAKVPQDEIVLGDLADQIISWLTKAGDIGMEFAPTIAQQVWPCVKAILKIPVREAEQMPALLSVADKVARVRTRGRVYERCFFKASGLPADVLKALHEDLIALYKACLELLAKAIGLLDKNCFQKTVHSILHPDAMIKEAGSDFSDLESRVSQNVEMASAEISKDLLIQIRKLDMPIARIDEGVSKVLKSTDEKEERKSYKWISPVLVWDHHRSVAEKRLDGTCEWLKDHTKFQDWKASSGCALLLLQGLSGAGKAFLTSKVIDDIGDKGKLLDSGPHDEALAFFYFSRNDTSRNSGLACLRSLVRQFKGRSPSPDLCEAQLVKSMDLFSRITIVLDTLDKCNEDDREGLVKTLTSLMGNSSRPLRVFISSRPDEQTREAVYDQASLEVSMEVNHDDIAKFILGKINSPDKNKQWKRIKKNLRDEVVSRLIEESQGMFRWAALQVHELLKLSSPCEVRERLGRLPRDLKATYDDIYKRQVTDRSEFATRVANRAIMWVMAADEPLTSEQLLSAVRINPVEYVETMAQISNFFSNSGHVTSVSENADYIDVHDEVEEEQLLELCANLLTWSLKDGVWALAHASVAEYFEDYHFSRVQAAKCTGTVCLAMVMDFYRSVTARRPLGAAVCLKMMNAGQDLEELLSTAKVGHYSPLMHHAFIRYAFTKWGKHMAVFDRSLGHDSPDTRPERAWPQATLLAPDGVGDLLRRFLGHPNNSSPVHRFWLTTCTLQPTGRKYETYYKKEYASFTMVIYRLFHLLRSWWQVPPASEGGEHNQAHADEHPASWVDTRVRTDKGWTLLHMACGVGHPAIVKTLLALGADANKQCDGRTPLSLACEQNRDEHLQIIRILTEDAECDPDLPPGPGNPLYLAAHYGHTNVLRALLRAGADPNRPIERKYLPSVSDEEEPPGSPLTAAVAANQIGALRVLIEEGHADPNMFIHDRYGMSTAAIWAAYKHRVDGVEYLIRHKHVDPNAPVPGDRRLKTVAIAAFAGTAYVRNKTKLFRRLVEIGVDFASFREAGGLKCLSDESYSDTHLRDAAEEGNLELIKILVEECGVDANYQPERGGRCALMAALSRCSPQLDSDDSAYLPVLQYLWEKGADLNVHTQDKHGSALALAVSSRQGDVVRWLLDHGADVNLSLRHGWHGSALIAAVSSGEMEMVKMLCDSGANVNLQTRIGDCGSALASAAARGYQEVAMCLLNHRAEINLALRYGTFRCALMAAAWAGEEDMVGFLLDHGANINFCGLR
ncbi:hypothetical protein FJTKL_03959 [Diaporthe vaccinii]|uniref:Nephrocystin 3-like N-terminal domain-containing protein n=1 Tax=Diaporthe vaccinii TaxID=105482 RepID=A0ABR4F1N0_9PEZI